ncbi:MAG: hypothetical protein QGG38_01500 [Nitrospinaceae bacterium]|jgi:hypothetical protein|nr:hypothetical protein [Nitrospinaceae bacterium]
MLIVQIAAGIVLGYLAIIFLPRFISLSWSISKWFIALLIIIAPFYGAIYLLVWFEGDPQPYLSILLPIAIIWIVLIIVEIIHLRRQIVDITVDNFPVELCGYAAMG